MRGRNRASKRFRDGSALNPVDLELVRNADSVEFAVTDSRQYIPCGKRPFERGGANRGPDSTISQANRTWPERKAETRPQKRERKEKRKEKLAVVSAVYFASSSPDWRNDRAI